MSDQTLESRSQLTLNGPTVPHQGTLNRRILDMLIDRRWVCGSEFADEVGWAFGARLSELRALGFTIEKRRCTHPRHHHKSVVWQYGLTDD